MILCTLHQVIHHDHMNSSEIFSVGSLPVLMNSSYSDLHRKTVAFMEKKAKKCLDQIIQLQNAIE